MINQIHQEHLRECLKLFGKEEGNYQFLPLTQGLINDTYLVRQKEDPNYVLQRINTNVFKDVDQLMRNMENALSYLQSHDYTSPQLLQTPTGKSYIHLQNSYWRLLTYIPGTCTFDSARNLKMAQEAGRIMGRFHQLLNAANLSEFTVTIPRFQDLDYRLYQYKQAETNAGPTRLENAARAMKFVKEYSKTLNSWNDPGIPVRICHNDTKLNNILFDEFSGKGISLIDLDTIMPGRFYMDFGDAVRTVVNAAEEKEKELSRVRFRSAYFTAFLKGLSSSAKFLLPVEVNTLYMGTIYMPFIHGVRALTDYLNGNVYYKTTYDEENLDRCLGLFQWVKCVVDEKGFINKEIQKFFPNSK